MSVCVGDVVLALVLCSDNKDVQLLSESKLRRSILPGEMCVYIICH